MLGDLFQLLRAYLRRQVRHIAVTVTLLVAGGVLILLALGLGAWALYLWLQIELGTFAALGILGGAFALTGLILLAIAFRRGGKEERDIVPVEPAATRAPARKRGRRNARESDILTILITLVVGWIVGRRTRR
jgi:uncharacterized membrane protein YedE/YeeE